MDVKNEMENLVREEIAAIGRSRAGRTGCWCSLCETDMVALALTLLPPMYCRTATYGYASGIATRNKIHDAAQAAVTRVSLRPKHRAGQPGGARHVSLVNYAWEIGAEMVSNALGNLRDGCRCEDCRSDALAYALNRYPAKYGVAESGRRKLNASYLEFMRHEIQMMITQAARIVAEHPHHGSTGGRYQAAPALPTLR
jgi:hypothetical protein